MSRQCCLISPCPSLKELAAGAAFRRRGDDSSSTVPGGTDFISTEFISVALYVPLMCSANGLSSTVPRGSE